MFQDITKGPGLESYSTYTWEILLMLLVAFLLGLLLGYLLWHRYKSQVSELEDENARLQSRLSDMEKDRASIRYAHDELEKDNNARKVRVRSLEADNSILAGKLSRLEAKLKADETNVGADAATMGAAIGLGAVGMRNIDGATASDDLKKIEGIGPKIASLLNEGGVYTFKQLSTTAVERLQEILTAAGTRYRMHDPGTWAKQAEHAAQGNWDKLKEYQEFLQGGKNPTK
ncbi:MAG: putative flap endonuclease-1-like 5' DNA nuclease [Saprospiraceae bacterium]|jgi:predicted flap endonuclease-1-like 5' DNA nuclease